MKYLFKELMMLVLEGNYLNNLHHKLKCKSNQPLEERLTNILTININ